MNVHNFLKLKHQETNSNDKNETERKTCCCGGIVGWVLDQIRKRLDDDRKFLNENWCSVLLLLTYMMAGFLFFRFNEKWGVVDSMYFAVVTFTTVGYGELVPISQTGRLFTIIYAILGVLLIGTIFSVAAEKFAEAQLKAIAKIEIERQNAVLDKVGQTKRSKSEQKMENHLPSYSQLFTSCFVFILILGIFLVVFYFQLEPQGDEITGRYTKTDIFYFMIITMTTIGYGDISPRTREARICGIFLIPAAVFSMGAIITTVASWRSERKLIRNHVKRVNKGLREEDLRKMDADGNGAVTMLEYVEFMLISMNKVDEQFLDMLHAQFKSLDVDNSGTLDFHDFRSIVVKSNELDSESSEVEFSQRFRASIRGDFSPSVATDSKQSKSKIGGPEPEIANDVQRENDIKNVQIIDENNGVETMNETVEAPWIDEVFKRGSV